MRVTASSSLERARTATTVVPPRRHKNAALDNDGR